MSNPTSPLSHAHAALERLREGNRRFVADLSHSAEVDYNARRSELAEGQSPFAVILGCSDSRVPAEIVFDQNLGDLFVIRVAGNIAAPSQIGSIEFAVAEFDTPLIVVLGHSQCGAVRAVLQGLADPTVEAPSPNLQSIVNFIQPTIEPLFNASKDHNLQASGASMLEEQADFKEQADLEERAVKANVRAVRDQLQQGSSLLATRVQQKQLLIVGAEYHLQTGEVEILDLEP